LQPVQALKTRSPKRAFKNFHTNGCQKKSVLLQTHLIRYARKAQDTYSVLPEMVAFKDPLTLDKGYLSSLGSSFVIEIQAHARRIGLERICKN